MISQHSALNALRLMALIVFLCALSLVALAETAKNGSPDALMQQGDQAYARGAFEEAVTQWKAAAQSYHAAGSLESESRALVSASQAMQALGQSTQALQTLELARELAEKSSDPVWRATVQAQLGRTYLAARQLDAAETHLNQARELAQKASSPPLMASVLNDLGVLYALK